MYFISEDVFLALSFATGIVGFVSGSTFTLMGVIAHEGYGLANISRVLGVLMTSAAVGILLYEEFVFDKIYEAYATKDDVWYQKEYGKWNQHIFLITLISSVVSLLFSISAHLRTKGDGGSSGGKGFVGMA